MSVFAKCNDLCQIAVDGQTHDGYVPSSLNLDYLMCGGDYVAFNVCANCGHLIRKWPLPAVISFDEEEEVPRKLTYKKVLHVEPGPVEEEKEEEVVPQKITYKKVRHVEPVQVEQESSSDWDDEDSVS